ncbi:hypothetical protein GCM10010885_09110 [Alicyclobacillus cellulosilyticus]|uniref:Dehydrogenase n=1 Tax=Alicyclobacillus cellulosilyticus TaxID=1003997 RepID=A0A917K7V5_9BACL|nr:Gfo/Idh/MocA family oxidoreductase [Alicyclobacillus cellulosilyticus]GGJ02031.1 hypothetical protein GCM10010885_09110 [Alicyclobacillus cellulosilyticus]
MSLRIGVVGAGGIGRVHLDRIAASGLAEVVAVCDVAEPVAAEAAARVGAAKYTDYGRMLAAERLDAVFLCVPPFAHGEMEEMAARRGVHLFVEKPLGLDMDAVRHKAEVIQVSGVLAAAGYCLRYHEPVEWAKSYLADKEIAMVVGFYHTSFVPTPWWRRMDLSGGQLVEQSTHIADLMRYLAEEVTRVHAEMALVASRDVADLDIYDVGCVNVRFASGAVGALTTTFTQVDHAAGVEVFGRHFRLRIDMDGAVLITSAGREVVPAGEDFYARQDKAFLQAVATGDASLIRSPYVDAARTLALTLAANASARSGQPVVPEDIE